MVVKETERGTERTNQRRSDPHRKKIRIRHSTDTHTPSQLTPWASLPKLHCCGHTQEDELKEGNAHAHLTNVCFGVAESARITSAVSGSSSMRCESTPATDGQWWVRESALNLQKCALTTARFSFRLQRSVRKRSVVKLYRHYIAWASDGVHIL